MSTTAEKYLLEAEQLYETNNAIVERHLKNLDKLTQIIARLVDIIDEEKR